MNWLHDPAGVDPELAILDNAEERRKVREEAHSRVALGWVHWLLFFVIVFASTQLSGSTIRSLPIFRALPEPVIQLFLMLVLTDIIAWLNRRLYRRRMRRVVRSLLRARGVRVCLDCGYDLRGAVESRCSECGTPDDWSQTLVTSVGHVAAPRERPDASGIPSPD